MTESWIKKRQKKKGIMLSKKITQLQVLLIVLSHECLFILSSQWTANIKLKMPKPTTFIPTMTSSSALQFHFLPLNCRSVTISLVTERGHMFDESVCVDLIFRTELGKGAGNVLRGTE